ncbi:c-type cytochrome [Planctomycetota bacterium]
MSKYHLAWITVVAAIPTLVGCGADAPTFSSNKIYTAKVERDTEKLAPTAAQDVANVVGALFGTPDVPHMLTGGELAVEEVLDVDNLAIAAGPITMENFGQGKGLYRQHCVHCHGITGDGRGPTASFLNPYPRDFRPGKFKFKSTPIGSKPTRDDLERIIRQGIEGTAMPAFHTALKAGEIEAVGDYVRYLAIRGETERKLLDFQATESSYEEGNAEANKAAIAELEDFELLSSIVGEVVDSWRTAEEEATEVEGRSEVYDRASSEFDADELAASIERGKKHYFGGGICHTCHGETQLGDGNRTDYDFWTKEYFDWVTFKGTDDYAKAYAKYKKLEGLSLQNIIPRNLRRGVYRGGRRPLDIYWRIKNGIEGGPMPAANATLFQDDDIWDIVNYVLSLPYEDLSRPNDDAEGYHRDRN